MAAPSAPPVGVSTDEIYAESVNLSWMPPLSIYQNGDIIGYNVTLTTVSSGIMNTILSASNRITISSLHPYTTYATAVAAITSAGVGPYSTIVTFITDESGSQL